MSTGILDPSLPDIAAGGPPPVRPPGGGNGGSGGGDSGGGRRRDPAPLAIFGMWIALIPILMLFLSFISAYVMRHGTGTDWVRGSVPRIVWVNTLLLLMSSILLERARALVWQDRPYRAWVTATLICGVAFVIGQVFAWLSLTAQGVYLSTSPYASFFFVLTISHAIHVAGGLAGLVAAALWPQRGWRGTSPSTTVRVIAIYWHFLGILWLLLFGLLEFWR
jgi:cytochrome c oxidase subunit 3